MRFHNAPLPFLRLLPCAATCAQTASLRATLRCSLLQKQQQRNFFANWRTSTLRQPAMRSVKIAQSLRNALSFAKGTPAFWPRFLSSNSKKKPSFFSRFIKIRLVPEVPKPIQPHHGRNNFQQMLASLKEIRIVPEIKIRKKAKRRLAFALLFSMSMYAAYEKWVRPKESRFRRRFITAFYVALIVADYKYSLRNETPGSEAYQLKLSAAHKRSADRIRRLANLNGGVYTKAAQFITSLNGVPMEYRKSLCALEDQAESRPFSEIKHVIMSEFAGKSLDELFLYVEEKPIAAASLAQVHRAISRTGEPIAVKVQYPLTERCFYSDLSNLSLAIRFVRLAFPSIELDWVVSKFTTEIEKELDFVAEGKNSEAIAALFKGRKILKIPRIDWTLTSKKVLTMELIEGIKINDKETLLRNGIDPRRLVESLYEVFGEMIFCRGFFHADPHPGNIMVQNVGTRGNFRIVLLDHGLYRRLDDEFRVNFCVLWKSLFPYDEPRLLKVCKKLRIVSHFQYFPLLISRTYWRSLKLISLKELASLEVFNLVENVSEDLLLIIKALVHLNYIASDLGISSIVAAKTLARFAYEGDSLFLPGALSQNKNRSYLSFYFRYFGFRLRFLGFSVWSFIKSYFLQIFRLESVD